VNDTPVQIVAEKSAFRRRGASGFRAHHVQTEFDTFSKLKPLFRRQGVGLGMRRISNSLTPGYSGVPRLATHSMTSRVPSWSEQLMVGPFAFADSGLQEKSRSSG
jgi:hypothetical protein